MMSSNQTERTRAQESRAAIQRLYIAMRHLFIRGSYKPLGMSGDAIIEALRVLRPEIYGAINDPERVELSGLLYIFQRLPKGIEECRYIRLISREGFEDSTFTPIVPSKRRRNSYRIDEEQMFIEMTRGRSDVYDILTHLTFMYIESEKIRRNSLDYKGRARRDWEMLEKIIKYEQTGEDFDRKVACTYLSTLLGRTYDETQAAAAQFAAASGDVNSLFHITYWLGKRSMEEAQDNKDREIYFSSALREKIGHHIYGELWANNIKKFLHKKKWLSRPVHIISANMHSVMNTIYGFGGVDETDAKSIEELARGLSESVSMRKEVQRYALEHGMYMLADSSGSNMAAQVVDTAQINLSTLSKELEWDEAYLKKEKPIIIVMDYAFGEQAFETMDELLKPYDSKDKKIPLKVQSISIMGKAGILKGGKGDIMVANAHIFEGTADNYPFDNDLKKEDFEGHGLGVYEGPMVSVMGTSLQNKDILQYFLSSSWQAVGLEMEGAHYQKAIQSASKIRNSISRKVRVRYAYYASDNPLKTGATLASGALGLDGVKPTYLVTVKILNKILTKS